MDSEEVRYSCIQAAQASDSNSACWRTVRFDISLAVILRGDCDISESL